MRVSIAKSGPGGSGPEILTPLKLLDRLAAVVPPPRIRSDPVNVSIGALHVFGKDRSAGTPKTGVLTTAFHLSTNC